ncbi:hypothetical protein KDH_13350 [Dictyobacter sp. S3.2.2.5]|uniref:Bacterial transcriptional activator domain-containing protein n=1 Tax=Dictyobacter halimunensis TaxID=3026934 RepID=A0ABQ6FPX8_9CHLR|nr:hypothetical protein KDH_13350 [Dictyobacter sp. S3.2.2.5]
MTQHNKITYHQQVTYCGKPRCRRCREGIGHGPYWYAYKTVNGQTTRTYIGKHLPPEVQQTLDTPSTVTGDSAVILHFSPLSTTAPESEAIADVDNVVLRISTLGQFRLEERASPTRGKQKGRNWRVIDDAAWQQRSVRALLSYLLCCPGRRSTRSQAILTLWPNDDLAVANNSLNKTLNSLRKILGHPSVKPGQEQPGNAGERFVVDGDWFALAGQERVWIDADEFERMAEQIEQGGSALAQYEKVLQDTIALYKGDFLLEERTSEWAVSRRQSLRQKWIDLLLKLSSFYADRNEYAKAINVLNNLLLKEPANELAIQQLLVALMKLKRRGEAIQAYQHFEKILYRDYKAVPAAETRALHAAIRSGEGLADIALKAESAAIQSPEKPASMRKKTGRHGSVAAGSAQARHVLPAPPSSEPIGRTHQGDLIGRDNELLAMRMLLRNVEQNARLQLVGARRVGGIPLDTQRQPQFLLLKGDLGIGKTRLAEELGREAQSNGWNVIWNRIYKIESVIPYRVWVEALRNILIKSPGVISSLSTETLRALSTLSGLLDVLPANIAGRSASLSLLPEQAKYALYNAVSDVLKQTSDNGPVLIVLDDIQWADVSSYELLGHLARQLTGYPIAFFATCRESEVPKEASHPLRKMILEMQREHTILPMDVKPLSPEQIKLLVTNLSPLPEEVVNRIQTHADGNPFFAEQLARSDAANLPMTIIEALGARIKLLKPNCRELLQHAAVLGGSFELPMICMLETGSDTDDNDVILPLLDEAWKFGVITDEGSGTRITYHFWHPLLVTYLYDNLSSMRRAMLHRKAAESIISLNKGREENVAATVTMHLLRAGAEADKIAYYAELAGNNAYSVSAYAAAATHYQIAVQYLKQVRSQDMLPQLISLLELLAECTMNSGGDSEKVCSLFHEALELRRSHMAMLDPQSEARQQALLWDQMSWTWRYRGDPQQAWHCWTQGEQLLRAAGVVGGPVWARLYYTRSNLYQMQGLYEQALHSAQEALLLLEEGQQQGPVRPPTDRKACKTLMQRIIEGYPDLLGRLQRHMGSIAVDMGQLSQALAYQNKALAFFEQYEEQRQIAHISSNLGFIHLKMAQYSEAQAALRRAQWMAESIGDRPLLSLVSSNLGELDAALGDLVEAEKQYEVALQLSLVLGDREYTSKWNSNLAGIFQARGELAEAARCIRTAFSVARSMQNAPSIGQALVALANIRLAQATAIQGDERKRALLLCHAQTDIERALGLEVEAETRMKGQLALAQITLMRGQQQEARQAFEEIMEEARSTEHLQIVEKAEQWLAQA